jgi:pyruvate formate lyase activating enzyme
MENSKAENLTARIHSIETCGTVDGPGLRYIAFFQGCNLRCKYCHNPDSWSINAGTEMTVSELTKDILKYKSFIDVSEGGFTAGGGEPLMQAEFITELFQELKGHKVHTTLDTSGYYKGDMNNLNPLLENTDLVLLDIKSIKPEVYRNITGVDILPTLAFAEILREKDIPVWLRHVVVPGLTDSEDDIRELSKYLGYFPNIERVELLPFHKMGEHKWEELKLPYTLKDTPVPTEDVMSRLRGIVGC